jgi:hypothetical protein
MVRCCVTGEELAHAFAAGRAIAVPWHSILMAPVFQYTPAVHFRLVLKMKKGGAWTTGSVGDVAGACCGHEEIILLLGTTFAQSRRRSKPWHRM